eukprot:sb/3470057/
MPAAASHRNHCQTLFFGYHGYHYNTATHFPTYRVLIESVVVLSTQLLHNRQITRSSCQGTNQQPTRTRHLGHVTGYQPIRDQYFGRFLILPGQCSDTAMSSEFVTESLKLIGDGFWGGIIQFGDIETWCDPHTQLLRTIHWTDLHPACFLRLQIDPNLRKIPEKFVCQQERVKIGTEVKSIIWILGSESFCTTPIRLDPYELLFCLGLSCSTI